MEFRIERDSMGEVRVPKDALYGAQTRRAAENFNISGIRFPRVFIRALGLIKAAAAQTNSALGLLDAKRAEAISLAAMEVADGKWDGQFPLDVFQTGSGTSTNMNANEVIAARAEQILGGEPVHPNDHANMGQSSNDVIPTAIHLSALMELDERLLPALGQLDAAIRKRAGELDGVIKTGRTHLMDAMPVRMSQELGGWAWQVAEGTRRIEACRPALGKLAMGGTAVGTGVNAHPGFGKMVAEKLAQKTGLPLREAENHFAAQSGMDAATELSGQLRTLATSLIKISDDLRWMNSGPLAGLGEISLPALQPGSSIMPGKVNPVACEAAMMACVQVMANDMAVAVAAGRGNFQLNTMLPLIAHNLLQSISILGGAARLLADKAVSGFTVNRERLKELLDRNPILVTALAPKIGYDKAAEIAKRAYAEGRNIKEVALEMTGLSASELDMLLNPEAMT
jgi:fumarate hydratase class II